MVFPGPFICAQSLRKNLSKYIEPNSTINKG